MIVLDKNQKIEYPTILTIGKFDGVHLGHKLLIDKLLSSKFKSAVVSFALAKNSYLNTNGYLLSRDEKINYLNELNIDYYDELVFDDKLKDLSYIDFFKKYIVEKYNAKAVVAGPDFCFGKNREGNTESLIKLSEEAGIEVYIIPKALYEDEAISSSRIRECILKGNIVCANNMLGFNYFIEGQVIYGRQLGRTIGFPTANILPDSIKVLPKQGVYKTYTYIDEVKRESITNIGKQPTVKMDSEVVIESHILNFDGNIYDKNVRIELVDFIRDINVFNGIEDLKKQLENDKKCWTI